MKHIQLFEEHSKKKSKKEQEDDEKMATMVVTAVTGMPATEIGVTEELKDRTTTFVDNVAKLLNWTDDMSGNNKEYKTLMNYALHYKNLLTSDEKKSIEFQLRQQSSPQKKKWLEQLNTTFEK